MVSINYIYQLCYSIAAKQSAAFPSPADFNLYANLANIDLFDYYNDEREKQLLKVKNGEALFAPPILSTFVENEIPMPLSGNSASLPLNYIYDIAFKTPINGVNGTIKKVDYERLEGYLNSTIDKPTATNPIYVELSSDLLVYPTLTNPCYLTYYRYPVDVLWAYTMVNGRPSFDSVDSVDFEWEETEFVRLTSRILKSMGLSIRDTELYQAAEQMTQEAS